MHPVDLSRARWHRSSTSKKKDACVEIADNVPRVVAVRDSKNPDGPALVVAPGAFRAFVGYVRRP